MIFVAPANVIFVAPANVATRTAAHRNVSGDDDDDRSRGARSTSSMQPSVSREMRSDLAMDDRKKTLNRFLVDRKLIFLRRLRSIAPT